MKVTGRYPVLNMERLLKDARKEILKNHIPLYCDIKDHNLFKRLGLDWTSHGFECRLFAVNKEFYLREMAPLYAECHDYTGEGGHYMEDVLFRFVKKNPAAYSVRFRREPIYAGFEGSWIDAPSFSQRQNSLKGKLKRAIGNGIRTFLPRFYF